MKENSGHMPNRALGQMQEKAATFFASSHQGPGAPVLRS
jgi:hypothetical protein